MLSNSRLILDIDSSRYRTFLKGNEYNQDGVYFARAIRLDFPEVIPRLAVYFVQG